MRGTSPKALKAPTLEGLRSGFGFHGRGEIGAYHCIYMCGSACLSISLFAHRSAGLHAYMYLGQKLCVCVCSDTCMLYIFVRHHAVLCCRIASHRGGFHCGLHHRLLRHAFTFLFK